MKYQYLRNITLAIISLVGVAGCQKQNAHTYDDVSCIYFYNKAGIQQDSTSRSFFLMKPGITFDTVFVKISTMGETSTVDRAYKIVQTNIGKADAATPGVHYVSLTDPSLQPLLVVPAGKAEALLPVVLLNDPSLMSKNVRIELEVAENENFEPGIKLWQKFLVSVTAMPFKPSDWDLKWSQYFGSTWGVVKMTFIIDTIGQIDWVASGNPAYYSYLASKVNRAFEEYNFANPNKPLKEADGTLVTF